MAGNSGTGPRRPRARGLAYRILAFLALASGAAFFPHPSNAGPLYSQIFAKLDSTTGIYYGAMSYSAMTPPNITSGFAVSPTAVGQGNVAGGAGYPFIEAGASKDCESGGDCQLHPYTAEADVNGHYLTYVDMSDLLASGGSYWYEAAYVGGTNWESWWEDGNGWQALKTYNLGTSSAQQEVGSGGEGAYGGLFTSAPIGTIDLSQNQYYDGTNWNLYCYTSVWNNVGGTITACGGNNDWTVSYGS
jgi:hypothetical protein